MVDAQRRSAVVPTPRGVASQFAASRSRTEALCSGADTAGGWHHSLQRAVVAQRRRRGACGREFSLLLCG